MLGIEFNTFQNHSADSKLSTNTYSMSVAAAFQKFHFRVTYVVWCCSFREIGYKFGEVCYHAHEPLQISLGLWWSIGGGTVCTGVDPGFSQRGTPPDPLGPRRCQPPL